MEIYPLAFSEHFMQPIMDNKAVKVVQFSFPKGKILKKHKTSSHILVLVVFGQVRFKADEEVLLQTGQLVSLEPNVEHSVEALEESIMLLILTPSPSAHTISDLVGQAGIHPVQRQDNLSRRICDRSSKNVAYLYQ